MVNQHLSGKGCYDFAILATGSRDISELDVDNTPPTTLTSTVADQAKTLVETAESLATNNNIDIFIVEHTPRYDPPTQDPTGMYAKLAKYANGVLASNVGVTPRLYIVEQSSLARSSAKPRSEVFKPDGVHLASKGLTYYTSNITRSLMECYPDMAMTTPKQHPKQPPSHDQDSGRGNRGDRDRDIGGPRSDRRPEQYDRRDRRYQDRPVYGYHGSQPHWYPDYPPPPQGRHGGRWGGNRQPRRQDQDWDYSGYSDRYRRGYRGQ